MEKSIKINDVNLNVNYSYNNDKDARYTNYCSKYEIHKASTKGIDILNIISVDAKNEIVGELEALRLKRVSNLKEYLWKIKTAGKSSLTQIS